MRNTSPNEVDKIGENRFEMNQTLTLTILCMNQGDNAKLKSSDNEKAQFTIFGNKKRTSYVHEISFCILFLDLLLIIFIHCI